MFSYIEYCVTGVSTTYWDKHKINERIQFVRNQEWNKLRGTYGEKESKLLHDTILHTKLNVKGKNVLVIGSINPWVETIFLGLGANHTVTLEYNKVIVHHPKVIMREID